MNTKKSDRKGGYELNDVIIVSAARLPIGRFGGSLREVSDWNLVE